MKQGKNVQRRRWEKAGLRWIKRKSFSQFCQCTLALSEPLYLLGYFWLLRNRIPKPNGLHLERFTASSLRPTLSVFLSALLPPCILTSLLEPGIFLQVADTTYLYHLFSLITSPPKTSPQISQFGPFVHNWINHCGQEYLPIHVAKYLRYVD